MYRSALKYGSVQLYRTFATGSGSSLVADPHPPRLWQSKASFMSNKPESAVELEPWDQRLTRQMRICYCQKWASEYAGLVTVGMGAFWSLLGFLGDPELSIYCLFVVR